MKAVLIVLLAVVIGVLGYSGSMLYNKMQISKGLVESAKSYQKITNDHAVTLLVLGDSTAVGVGATKPEDSIAGRLADHMRATYVENVSVSGAQVDQLPTQIQVAKLDHYTTILIQIGGNDIIRFHSATKTAETLGAILKTLPSADHVIVMPPGNLGAATLIPFIARGIYTHLNLKYHEAFAKVVGENNGIYINLYRPSSEDPFVAHPEIYLAGDAFHPSSAGYELWYNALISRLE